MSSGSEYTAIMLPKPEESSSVKMGIGSLAFSPPLCLLGVPGAPNIGKGHTPLCSNFNTTLGLILTSPNTLEMLFLHNAGWSGDLYSVPASFGLMFTAPPLSAECFHALQHKVPNCNLLGLHTGLMVQQDITQVAWYCFLHNHVSLFLEEMLLSLIFTRYASSKATLISSALPQREQSDTVWNSWWDGKQCFSFSILSLEVINPNAQPAFPPDIMMTWRASLAVVFLDPLANMLHPT